MESNGKFRRYYKMTIEELLTQIEKVMPDKPTSKKEIGVVIENLKNKSEIHKIQFLGAPALEDFYDHKSGGKIQGFLIFEISL